MFLRKRIKPQALNALFNGHFIDVKAYYALEFDSVASISFIGEVDTSGVYSFIIDHMKKDIKALYQHTYFDHAEQELFFNNTIFVLRGKRMIELGNNYCTVLYTAHQHRWGTGFIRSLSRFRIVSTGNPIGFMMRTTMN